MSYRPMSLECNLYNFLFVLRDVVMYFLSILLLHFGYNDNNPEPMTTSYVLVLLLDYVIVPEPIGQFECDIKVANSLSLTFILYSVVR